MGWFSGPAKVTRVAALTGAVPRIQTSLLQQRGWSPARWSNGWSGPYASPLGTFAGSIEKAGRGQLRVYIKDPPSILRLHPKWVCFHAHGGDGWWRVHLHTQPADGDPSSVIRYVEQILAEACHLHS